MSQEQALGRETNWRSAPYGLPEKIRVHVRIYATFELITDG